MSICVVTGAAGLIGSEAVRFFAAQGLDVIGIDNDLRSHFFGPAASTAWNRQVLEQDIKNYRHEDFDIRDFAGLEGLFASLGNRVAVVIHCAAQPSHDWAASDVFTDFSVNATGTLNMLECVRRHAPEAVFLHMSTNKVYGDRPNTLPLIEHATRWEIDDSHPYYARGIDESMSIDASMHSLFGVSKASSDLLVQEYGRYFGLRTACFRGGCLTGPAHSGTQLHGFLAYLMRCTLTGQPYTIFGYKGKQVRDNIHSHDVVRAMWEVFNAPRHGEIYNLGGGRFANCSMLEAISLCEGLTGKKLDWTYADQSRAGDHIWYISDMSRFQNHYPDWQPSMDLPATLAEIRDALALRIAAV
jgi:CDP-paratose 2-epimerase